MVWIVLGLLLSWLFSFYGWLLLSELISKNLTKKRSDLITWSLFLFYYFLIAYYFYLGDTQMGFGLLVGQGIWQPVVYMIKEEKIEWISCFLMVFFTIFTWVLTLAPLG